MQFFDLSRQFNLSEILTPSVPLDDLSAKEWFLAKIRVDHDCVHDTEQVEGQAILKSHDNITIEMEWIIQDTGSSLDVLFKGIETVEIAQTLIVIKGANVVDEQQQPISTELLSLWIDGTLLPMLPQIRQEIKSRLNLWDYVDYDV